jgi:MFS family permease
MSGPFIGAALYHFFGYQVLFYVVGGLFSLSLIPTFLALPEDNQEFKKTITLNPKVIYGDRNILLLALVVTMTSAGTCFINPMFSIHMGTYQI